MKNRSFETNLFGYGAAISVFGLVFWLTDWIIPKDGDPFAINLGGQAVLLIGLLLLSVATALHMRKSRRADDENLRIAHSSEN
ncbi:MAG: hypothetical protein GX610_00550 [Rhodococcus sp.]|nr:hypothetical protein [Rhodococcus sp. (in: high G+C Gram-positive bacteria)]